MPAAMGPAKTRLMHGQYRSNLGGRLKLFGRLRPGLFHLCSHVIPPNQLQAPVEMLDNCRARFNPVAAIDVEDWSHLPYGGVMDVPAYHHLRTLVCGVRDDGVLKCADETYGLFHHRFGRGGE